MEPWLKQFTIKIVIVAVAAAAFYYAISPYERCIRQHGADLTAWCGDYSNW